jgi:hypothetical protein
MSDGTSSAWPSVTLSNVERMRVLGAVIPNAQVAEAVLDAPFERVWSWFSDLEHSIPSFDGQVRRLRVDRRDGHDLRITAWQGPGARMRLPFDVLLEPDGWCLMTAARRLYVVGMCADALSEAQTHVALLEAVPRSIGRIFRPFLAHHVDGDIERIVQRLR